MITIPGQLAVRTVNGRHGPFNVGRLITSTGEFAVKDVLLDQLDEGKYDGNFVVSEIKLSSYVYGGRTVTEIRAVLDDMTLDEMDDLPFDEASEIEAAKAQDPLEEEQFAVPTKPEKEKPAKAGKKAGSAESGDEVLFGILWPLGDEVKLDVTVDRATLRAQKARLEVLGYELDFKTQTWSKLASF